MHFVSGVIAYTHFKMKEQKKEKSKQALLKSTTAGEAKLKPEELANIVVTKDSPAPDKS